MFKCSQSRSFRMFLAFRLVTFTVRSHIRWCISYSDAAKFSRILCPNITQISNFRCIITLGPSVSLGALCLTILFKPSGKIPELDGRVFFHHPFCRNYSEHHHYNILFHSYTLKMKPDTFFTISIVTINHYLSNIKLTDSVFTGISCVVNRHIQNLFSIWIAVYFVNNFATDVISQFLFVSYG